MRSLLARCWVVVSLLLSPLCHAASSAVSRPASEPEALCGISALRLLPVLIGVGAVLVVTLRAFILLQREMNRRIQTEQRLATQLSFQQTMMEVVPYPLVAKDMDNRYIAVNRAFESALGVRREDVIGRTSIEAGAWGEVYSRLMNEISAATLQSGQGQEVEAEFVDKRGRPRYGLFWTGAFSASNGERVGVVGTMIDITDIRDAELRARQTEQRLHDVTRSLPAVVFQLRRTTGGRYSLPYIDGDTRQLLGLDLAALAADPTTILRHVDAEDSGRLFEEIEASSRTLEPVHTEFRATVKGVARWIRADLVAHREDDGSVVWSGYWADASVEHARAEELARARDAAEAASRAKDDFLAMMSHEIRTPMNGVLGLVEVIENTPLNQDQAQMLGMIQDSASALLQILDDLLDYTKIEAGRLTIESMPIDLRELVDNAVGLLAGRAHEKGLRVRVDVAPDVAASLRSDSVRLRQILFNLMSNAIKFTIKGEVSLYVRAVEKRATEQVIELCVSDTGIGIDPAAQARLFEPFVQAETSITRRFGGTGLGLTICNRLVDLMGGTLTLQSEVGVGTSMTVRLEMPVETQHYQMDGLRGRRGIVAIEDTRVATALLGYGQALGLNIERMDSDDPRLRRLETFDGVDLVFFSDTRKDSLPLGSRVIHVTEKPKPTGYRILEDDIRVSVNPLSWRGLRAACVAALTGMPQVAVHGTLDQEPCTEAPGREDALHNGKLVLVAEDHPVNQELIRHQLSLLGFACDVVQDGAEALAALETTRYGFLITDCHMPNMTGYELARRVRAKEKGTSRRLPILAITASTCASEATRCREAGMDDYLVKPTRLATLREHLNRWRTAERTDHRQDAQNHRAAGAGRHHDDEIDLAAMAQLWGSEATVKALLDAFVTSFRDDLRALEPLLERGTVEHLREWHHRVVGAASVLQYRPLLDALEEFRRDLPQKSRDVMRREGRTLIERCTQLLKRIEAQCAAIQ
ncbi:ATP-binding protein [Caballeronia sp. LZ062]|uniref:hybrid sensor histidine kinase/response regulator n=1 Tax=unclassified Caballeronia TaxID=2646786 RepID=UPI00285EA82D|nr:MULTISPECIES: ATP-binding protein [unclassified Caballeronia]MDR5853530.1 ATP-binding protein [Caballeronia sp. LZ050]MDR5871936.1 ATP-binding protein [Caballeronia sp. LZ062]